MLIRGVGLVSEVLELSLKPKFVVDPSRSTGGSISPVRWGVNLCWTEQANPFFRSLSWRAKHWISLLFLCSNTQLLSQGLGSD